ncbi:MAG: methyltransferase domain-containing protein [Pseudomonadota bacterium]|nr:methyltransferase domain-containing protein [Pseudomonadota bacterium]
MARSSRSPERVAEPEWLDELPPQDRRAVRSRGDLRRINTLMGNARCIARHLSGRKIADLGAGDGSVMLSVARRLQRPGVELTLVDRSPVVADSTLRAFSKFGWAPVVVGEDAFNFLRRKSNCDAIVANLFLHHFDDERLAQLLALAATRAPLFIACEPRRSRLAVGASRLLGLIGCNDVTRHDALVSVRAGFSGDELSELWPKAPGWRLSEGPAWPFSHLFVAQRDGAA